MRPAVRDQRPSLLLDVILELACCVRLWYDDDGDGGDATGVMVTKREPVTK